MGRVAVSERIGMLKTYDLIERHFGWDAPAEAGLGARHRAATSSTARFAPRASSASNSVCYGDVSLEAGGAAHRSRPGSRRKELVPVAIEGAGKQEHWAAPETLEAIPEPADEPVHILSPFDPLVIQRKRLALFFGYDHVFEAYVPKAKRRYGYFALPVLVGDRIVAVARPQDRPRRGPPARPAVDVDRRRREPAR